MNIERIDEIHAEIKLTKDTEKVRQLHRELRQLILGSSSVASSSLSTTKPIIKLEDKGIGTELTLILNSLGLKGYSGCKCKAIADWMNRIGLQGCLENRELILAKLRKAQQDLGWLDEKKAQFLGLVKGLAFKLDKNDPAPGLLDEAIRRWREKHPEGS